MKIKLICSDCAKTYTWDEPVWQCGCGGLLDVDFEPVFDPYRISSANPGLWRYRDAIPLPRDIKLITLGEGMTPLLKMELWGRAVHLKQDQLHPTGSYKDRGSAVMITRLHELGIGRIVEDSSGNAGVSVAAYASAAGIKARIVVPARTTPRKLAQIRYYRAEINQNAADRTEAEQTALQLSSDCYYASHVRDPFFLQGVKTFAFEIWEELGWKAPDSIFLPLGNGILLAATFLGFAELEKAGLVEKVPKIFGIQAAGCAPLYQAFIAGSGKITPPVIRNTIAEGVAVASPRRAGQILSIIKQTSGGILAVEDTEIQAILDQMSSRGFLIEPTSAVALAGLKQYLEKNKTGEVVVTTFTGTGLKTIS